MDSEHANTERNRESMRTELSTMYAFLTSLRMQDHARDFWKIRASKQKIQVDSDALLHQHTALTQYMLWHDINGARLPKFQRGTALCLQQLP